MTDSRALELWGEVATLLTRRGGKSSTSLSVLLGVMDPAFLGEDELVLSTSYFFAKERLESKYLQDIKEALFITSGRDYSIRIVFTETEEAVVSLDQDGVLEPVSGFAPLEQLVVPSASLSNTSPLASGSTAQPSLIFTPQPSLESQGSLDEGDRDVVSFDSFVVGDSNKAAYSMAVSVAKNPGLIYNPLFIYGKSGLGKTHLLLSIKEYIERFAPQLRVTYEETRGLVNDYTTMIRMAKKADFGIKDDNHQLFHQKYYNADIILLDDVQYLESKIETTNELFNIINKFKGQNKQIVFAGDRNPNEIDLDERFKSRFKMGVIIDIQPPTNETKYRIFEDYLNYTCRRLSQPELGALVKEPIINHIIEQSGSNMRDLQGVAAGIVSHLTLSAHRFENLTIEEADEIVSRVFMNSAESRIDVTTIQNVVENHYKVSHNDIIGSQRSQNISFPRQVAMYLTRNMTDLSYPEIGKAFGGKDHTSVMYACGSIDKKRELNKKIDNEVNHLVSVLKQ